MHRTSVSGPFLKIFSEGDFMRRFDDWEFVRPGDDDWAECYDNLPSSDRHEIKKMDQDPSLIMLYNLPKYVMLIGAGDGDTVYIYSEKDTIGKTRFYVYSSNEKMGYAGLDIYKFKLGHHLKEEDNYFEQNVSEAYDYLPKDFFEYTIPNQIKIMDPYHG